MKCYNFKIIFALKFIEGHCMCVIFNFWNGDAESLTRNLAVLWNLFSFLSSCFMHKRTMRNNQILFLFSPMTLAGPMSTGIIRIAFFNITCSWKWHSNYLNQIWARGDSTMLTFDLSSQPADRESLLGTPKKGSPCMAKLNRFKLKLENSNHRLDFVALWLSNFKEI